VLTLRSRQRNILPSTFQRTKSLNLKTLNGGIKSCPIGLNSVRLKFSRVDSKRTHDVWLMSILGQPITGVRMTLQVTSGDFVLIRCICHIVKHSHAPYQGNSGLTRCRAWRSHWKRSRAIKWLKNILAVPRNWKKQDSERPVLIAALRKISSKKSCGAQLSKRRLPCIVFLQWKRLIYQDKRCLSQISCVNVRAIYQPI
jgi:hypothetical protein